MMKNRSFVFLIIIGFVTLYLFGCAGTAPVSRTKTEGKSGTAVKGEASQIEDLNPQSLPDQLFVVKENPQSAQAPSTKSEQAASAQPGESVKETVKMVPGYRIQIAALSNQEEAMDIRKDAMLKFANQEVYLIFDPPYYKIRVGDFLTRYDAEKLQKEAIKMGYKDAWIVRTRVKSIQSAAE
ncbi:MAG: SPOR domain-containing protein [Calditrichaeota bacterium]|nr:SPOR domain-containing protein [Calditrichota bacterium]